MSLKSIWIIGDWRELVFEEAIAWLRLCADCVCFDSVAAASKKYSEGRYPQAIVLVQSRPGRFCGEEVEKLHRREPLTRLIALTGPWCEGEQRSGRPIPGVVRVAWRNWRERLPLELDLDAHKLLEPRTATEADRVERMVKIARDSCVRRGLALVCAARRDAHDQFADAIQKLGLEVLPYGMIAGPPATPDVVIFDGWEQTAAFKKNSTVQNGQPRARRILFLHFPRPDDHVLAREAGIDAVIGQPLSLADLNSALSSTMAPAA